MTRLRLSELLSIWIANVERALDYIRENRSSLSELLGFISSLLGVIGFLILGKVTIDRWIDDLRPPTRINFYFLFFCSVAAASIGGMLWAILNRLNNQYLHLAPSLNLLGGTSSEPHGIAVILWAITTLVPVVLIVLILGWRYHFAQIRQRLLLYGAFLIGATIGSVIFYDFPLGGKDGFRNYLDSLNMPSSLKEVLLVVIWSSLLSILGFLFMALMKVIVARRLDLWTILKQIGLCIGLTTFAVDCFLLGFPDLARYDTARGFLAGLALRMTLFFGLLSGTNAIELNPLHAGQADNA
jgi:hypothetical protein